MTFPLSPTDFPERFPSPDSPREMAEAISEISRFRLHRAFRNIITVAADYTIEAEWDRVILVDASGGAVVVTLPAAANADATEYVIKALDVTGGNVSVTPLATEEIDGAGAGVAYVLAVQYHLVRVASDGTAWWVTGRHT